MPLLYFDDFYPSLPHLPHPIRHSMDYAAKEITEQIDKVIENTVEYNYEKTEELSISGNLSELKVRLNELHDSVPKIIEQKFEKFSINKKENINWFKEIREYELKEKLFTLYKSIIGEAGKIFREYGYKDVSGESSKGHLIIFHSIFYNFIYLFSYFFSRIVHNFL